MNEERDSSSLQIKNDNISLMPNNHNHFSFYYSLLYLYLMNTYFLIQNLDENKQRIFDIQ